MMPETCLISWQTDGCEWSLRSIWRSSDYVERGILIGLVLMLVYTLFVLLRFSRRYYLARRECRPFGRDDCPEVRQINAKLVADSCPGLGMLRGIATAAPFLGLVGTCYGVLAAFSVGYSGSLYWFVSSMFARVSAKLITAALGILVAVPAVLIYNILRSGIERIKREVSVASPNLLERRFRRAQTLPLKRRFSRLPPYALVAAPIFSIFMMIYMELTPNEIPKGLPVRVALDRCEPGLVDRTLVLRITDEGAIFLNTELETWDKLASRLAEIYRMRQDRTLYLQADDEVRFQTVADAIDIARSGLAAMPDSPRITLRLITPQTRAANGKCHSPLTPKPLSPN